MSGVLMDCKASTSQPPRGKRSHGQLEHLHHHPSHMRTAFDHRHPRLAVSILKPTIPEHSLQSLYISPAIAKKKNHRQTHSSVNKSRYISVLLLPVAQWGRMCCRAKHLARIPSDTLTQPLFLEPWPFHLPTRSDLLNTGAITTPPCSSTPFQRMQHATTSREHDIHQVRLRRNRQR